MTDEQQIDRRQNSDRIVRLETVVERLETDIVGLMGVYKEIVAQQQAMFIEAVKSSTALQSSIDKLNATVANFAERFGAVETKVEEHDNLKMKLVGMVIGASAVINVVVWLASKVMGQ